MPSCTIDPTPDLRPWAGTLPETPDNCRRPVSQPVAAPGAADDGSAMTGEVLNLLGAAEPSRPPWVDGAGAAVASSTSAMGSREYPVGGGGIRARFALKVSAAPRTTSGPCVVAHLRQRGRRALFAGDGTLGAAALLNYGGRDTFGLRIRTGRWAEGRGVGWNRLGRCAAT